MTTDLVGKRVGEFDVVLEPGRGGMVGNDAVQTSLGRRVERSVGGAPASWAASPSTPRRAAGGCSAWDSSATNSRSIDLPRLTYSGDCPEVVARCLGLRPPSNVGRGASGRRLHRSEHHHALPLG